METSLSYQMCDCSDAAGKLAAAFDVLFERVVGRADPVEERFEKEGMGR